MTTFGIEEFPNERIQLLVRTSALIDIALKGKNDTTRRLTLASIWHGIHFIPPPGEIKNSLNDSADSSTDHGRKTLKLSRFRCNYRPPSLIGFRCRFVAPSVPYRKNFPFFNPWRSPCLLVEQKSNYLRPPCLVTPCCWTKIYVFLVPPQNQSNICPEVLETKTILSRGGRKKNV